MINALVLGIGAVVCLATGVVGYLLGRYQSDLIDKIRTLEEQSREKPLEPEKPTVAGGAYQPPNEVSNTPSKERRAGLVETKTPQLLEWENDNNIEKQALGR